MLRYIVRRVLFLIPVLLGVAFCVFTLLYLTPGDPARMVLGDLATEDAVQEFRNREGLNDSFLVQFGSYVWKAVMKGDIGRSYITKRSVAQEVLAVLKVLLLTDKQKDYAETVTNTLKSKGFRVEIDTRNEKIGYKIREGQLQKIPYLLIIGEKEKAIAGVAVRHRKDGDLGIISLEEFIDKLATEEVNKL